MQEAMQLMLGKQQHKRSMNKQLPTAHACDTCPCV
jgi:hypothetical protein